MFARDVAPGSEYRTWPKQWLTNLVESVGGECLSVCFAVEIRLLFAIDFKLASFAVCSGGFKWTFNGGFKRSRCQYQNIYYVYIINSDSVLDFYRN